MLDVLQERLERLILAEIDTTTREVLFQQLQDEGFADKLYPPREVLENAERLGSLPQPVPPPSSLLALVDPFRIDESPWKEVAHGLCRLAPRNAPQVWLLYTNTRASPYEWSTLQPNPAGLGLRLAGRAAKNYGGSAGGREGGIRAYHNLAVYSTQDVFDKARAVVTDAWGCAAVHPESRSAALMSTVRRQPEETAPAAPASGLSQRAEARRGEADAGAGASP